MAKISIKRLFIFIAIYSLVANFAHPITPTLIQNLKLNDYMFGVAFAAMALTNFVFSPFWGKIANQMGCIKTSALCFVGYGIGQAIFGVAQGELMIVVGRLISGLFIGGIMVCQLLYVIENSELEKRSVNLAITATISAVVSPFGFLIGGFLGDISIELTFLIQVLGLILTGILYIIFLKDRSLEKDKETFVDVMKSANPFKVIVDSKKLMTPTIIVFLTIAMFASFAVTSHEQSFNYYIKDVLQFPPSYNGILKASVGFIALLANSTICVWIMKKTNLQKSLIGLLLSMTVSLSLMVVIDADVTFIVLNVVIFAIVSIYLPVVQANLAKLSNKDSGVMIGVFNSIKSLGMVVGSLFAGIIYASGPKLSFIYAAIACGIAFILAIINYKQTKNRVK